MSLRRTIDLIMFGMSPRTFVAYLFLGLFFLVPQQYAHALTLSPVKAELSGDPGQTINAEVELYNEQAEPKTFYTSFENFEPSGEDGSPKFVGGRTGLATWLQAGTVVTLEPGERKVVPYTVTIPSSAEPGGYFAAVFFGGQNPEVTEGGEVSVGGKLGTLILLRVRGDIVENAGLTDFMTAEGKRFFAGLPIDFTYRITNSGADRIVPTGDIRITNTFGMTAETLVVNEKAGSILPNSARRFQASWGGIPAQGSFFEAVKLQWENLRFGWYTAHARVVWGEENTQAAARYDFFIIPWQLSIVSVLILGLLVLLLRKYNSWIVSRAQKN